MDFQKHAGQGDEMLAELATELGFPENKELAFRIMKSTLHVLRGKLSITESLQLLTELPFVVKAMYVDGWEILGKPEEIQDVKDFVRMVVSEDYPDGHHDFQTVKDAENAVIAVFKVLKNHVSESELKSIRASLPPSLHSLVG